MQSVIELIDTHTHLYLDTLKHDRKDWLERMLASQVTLALLPNIDLASRKEMLDLCDAYPNHFKPMMGLHPCDVKADAEYALAQIKESLYTEPDRYCGVGEIGLDYHWDLTYQKEQIAALHTQIGWALDLNKAVSIHSRKANQDLIPILRIYQSQGLQGVMHCFSGSIQEAEQIIEAGFLLGVGGVVTYPKSGLSEIIAEISLDHIVLETDSPFLPPVPHRGQRNESAYIRIIAEKIAAIKECSLEEVAQKTTSNAKRCFQLS